VVAREIGYCITPHGFGHAARAAAVMEAVAARTEVLFHVVTEVPEWFFQQSLSAPFVYHRLPTDVGLVQQSAFQEDLEATLAALAALYPLGQQLVDQVSERLSSCSLVVCDIAPLGIEVAKNSGALSVLVENFTWDWIYAGYAEQHPGLRPFIDYLETLFSEADYHVQTAPICRPAACDCQTAPVARKPRTSREDIRRQLQIGGDERMILVTMGGISGEDVGLQPLRRAREWVFVLPGYADTLVVDGNLRLLAANSGIYHPDLIHASDAVIGKVGYSTLAEVWRAGVPYGYVCRTDFRESGPLAAFIRKNMAGLEIASSGLRTGEWLASLPELVRLGRSSPAMADGADQVADFLLGLPPVTGRDR